MRIILPPTSSTAPGLKLSKNMGGINNRDQRDHCYPVLQNVNPLPHRWSFISYALFSSVNMRISIPLQFYPQCHISLLLLHLAIYL